MKVMDLQGFYGASQDLSADDAAVNAIRNKSRKGGL
jgi:hypothetical protein